MFLIVLAYLNTVQLLSYMWFHWHNPIIYLIQTLHINLVGTIGPRMPLVVSFET